MSPVWIRLHTGEVTAQQHVMVMFGPRDGSVCISSKTLRGLFFQRKKQVLVILGTNLWFHTEKSLFFLDMILFPKDEIVFPRVKINVCSWVWTGIYSLH